MRDEADAGVLGGQLLHRRVRHHRGRVLARHVVRYEGVVGAAKEYKMVKTYLIILVKF